MLTTTLSLEQIGQDYKNAAGKITGRIVICAGTGCIANGAMKVFHAFEIGVAFDAYIGKVPIMATSPGKLLFVLPDDQFYLTLFISYRFGRVIDTRFNQRRNKVDRMLTE